MFLITVYNELLRIILMSANDLKPEISIIIPAYNSEKTVLRSINNLLNQDIINCELIIVNDGSTDNTKDVILNLIENECQDNNIKLINQQNRGLGAPRNTGITNSTANYITFLDADDTLNLNVLKEAADKTKKGNYDII